MKISDIMNEDKDVPEIMSQLRQNMSRPESSLKPHEEIDMVSEIQPELAHIKSEWDIQNKSYQIHSHRPLLGKALVKGREIVHGEVQRYVDPTIIKQMEFNRNVSSILEQMVSRTKNIQKDLEDARTKIKSQIEEMDASIDQNIETMIDRKIDHLLGEMQEEIENKAWLASILERRKASDIIPDKDQAGNLGINYFLFEERFRGLRSEVSEKQQRFVHFFRRCKNVLDIGCGRGEFLELLQKNSVEAKGIDIDPDMVSYCTSRGLNAELIDAISYLEKMEDKSLDGIFLDQVVEHLEPEYLIKLLDLCHRKLNYGYFIIIETVNPLSLFSFINFYIDMTHIKPVHPDTLKFLLTAVGFRGARAQFFAPVADERRLKRLETDALAAAEQKRRIEIYNQNTDILNDILFGPQDYAIIGKK